ncbi:DUF3159 domain-containing protein [Actinotalea fermentans]|uniref:DUF3159 domain-containing protein n=1 Tax=Actinotalea fermentans TaxID=43671 RepID=A0A511YU65_9CELL|nr:DUF3159 domain-containing protein [Actinotalea fermentans]KGM17023.1 hypothetical protein N867_11555 [Actinotalea fermentans ATCC 43279 = JCM 9966 = DSM 3133]GEN78737.1 hypothetical protein AFE02nite_04710 [Actinotalea fermentans]
MTQAGGDEAAPAARADAAGPDAAGPGAAGAEPLRGLRAVTGEDFSFADAIGGVRGLVESTLPGLLFVVVFVATRELTPALVASVVVALAAVVVRLVQRTPVTQAFSGVLGIAVGVAWAWWSGRAQDFFAGGLLANVGYLVAMVVSIAARWPAVGVVVALLRGEDSAWRTDPERSHERRRFVWATWVMAAVFALRLAVQVPLYLAGESAVAALGTAKLAMGLPLFAVGLWVTWLLVGSRAARADLPDPPPTQPR